MEYLNMTPKKKCCVPGCSGSLIMHRFPREQAQSQMWLSLINNPELVDVDFTKLYNNRRVCSLHFEEGSYVPKCGRKLLKKDALPSLHLKILVKTSTENETLRSAAIFPVPVVAKLQDQFTLITEGSTVELDTQHEVCCTDDNDLQSQHADGDENENITIDVTESSGSIKTCRICMEEVADDAKNIFEDNLYDDVPIHLGISDCIYPIKVSIEDPLTKYACTECLEDLCSFVKFRNFVIRNDKIQRDRIDGIDPLIINNEADSKKRKTEEDNECHQKKKKKKINGLELTPCPTQRMSFAVVDVDEEGTVIVKNRIKQSNEKSNHLIVEREDELSNSIQDSTLQVNNSSPNTDVNIYFCMVNGYLMEHKFSKENTRYYKCALSKCPALAKQELHVPGLSKKTFILIQPHKHEKPTELEIKKQKIISVVRKKLQITKGSTIKSIYDDVSKLDPAVAELLPMKALMSEICNL